MKSIFQRWLPVLLWALIIFAASANSDPYKILPGRWNEPCFSAEADAISCDELLGRFLHTSEYAVLAILIARAMIWRGDVHLFGLVVVLGLSELYALSDEIHQLFVPGREFQLMDLGLDLFGCVIGLSLYVLFRKKSK